MNRWARSRRIRHRLTLPAIFIGVWFVGLVADTAQGQSLLRLRFDSGEAADYSTRSRTLQRITLAGRTVESSIDQNMELEVSCEAPDSSGRVLVTYHPKSLTVESVSDGERFSFDSAQDSAADAEGDSAAAQSTRLFAALGASSWQVLVDQDLQVLEFRGRDHLLERLDPEVAASLKPQFDPEYLKSQAQSELQLFPDRALRVGDRWRRERELRLEAGMRLLLTEECKYLGGTAVLGSRRHRVEIKTLDAAIVRDESLVVDGEAVNTAELQYSNLEVKVSRGDLIFDETLGVVVSMNRHVEIQGDLTVTLGTRAIDGTIELTLDEEQSRLEATE